MASSYTLHNNFSLHSSSFIPSLGFHSTITTTSTNPTRSIRSYSSSLNNLSSCTTTTRVISSSKSSSYDTLLEKLDRYPTTLSHQEGSQIHAQLLLLGLLSKDIYLSSKLLYFYYCVSDTDSARFIFNSIPPKQLNQFFWNTMIRTYVDSTCYDEAIDLFSQMLFMGFLPNQFTYPFVLKSCSVLKLVEFGRQIHGFMIVNGYDFDVFSMTSLLDFYVKCGLFWDACKMFDRIPQRNEVTWNTMVSGYAQNGYWDKALEALELMRKSGIKVGISSWNSIMAGCVRCGNVELTFETLRRMLLLQDSLVTPNSATFNTLLPIVPTGISLRLLKEIHGFTIRQQQKIAFDSVDVDKFRSLLASGYAYHGVMEYATQLFDGVQLKSSKLWISMIAGFTSSGQSHEAFCLFRDMVVEFDGETKSLSKVPLTLLLPECSPSTLTGLEIHAHALKVGFGSNTSVNNALIAMYARRGDIESSIRVFLRMPEKDVVSWNSMANSFAVNHHFDQSLNLFYQMHSEGIKPDKFTFSSVLNGCGELGAHRQGSVAHGYITRSGFLEGHLVVQNALMDMYGKCGCIEEAKKVFDEMEYRDDVSWNTIIKIYGLNACPNEAISLFYEMQEDEWRPNRITFISLLSACSHGGLVEEGLHFLKVMSTEYHIKPDIEHYTCIVDNLGRVGRLEEAYNLIKTLPVEPDDCIWGALLGACRIHRNVTLAEIAAKHLMELKPQHPGYYVLLSNIYKDASRRNEASDVRTGMKDRGVKKFPGYSWIEVSGDLHYFMTADKSHKKSSDIYSTLDGLTEHLTETCLINTLSLFAL